MNKINRHLHPWLVKQKGRGEKSIHCEKSYIEVTQSVHLYTVLYYCDIMNLSPLVFQFPNYFIIYFIYFLFFIVLVNIS